MTYPHNRVVLTTCLQEGRGGLPWYIRNPGVPLATWKTLRARYLPKLGEPLGGLLLGGLLLGGLLLGDLLLGEPPGGLLLGDGAHLFCIYLGLSKCLL